MEKVIHGVSQGSISRPLLFNICLNDIFYFTKQAVIYNYANGNILSFIDKNLEILKQVLENESSIRLKCFSNNFMQANLSKFQAICIGKMLMMLYSFQYRLGGIQV